MKSSNYLIDFLYQVDVLISEIDKLNSKVRLYQRNCEIFDMDFNVNFSISLECFIKLRDFLHQKIENGNCYDRDIVNLKRNFSKQLMYLVSKIEQEIIRIDDFQEKEMNKIVYKEIYKSRFENEINSRNSYYRVSSIFEKFLGIAKYRRLMVRNHDLRSKIIVKEYDEKARHRKSIFELVCLIEDEDIKTGEILCLQDKIIKAFMIDKNVVKRNEGYVWKKADLLPSGIFEKRAYYKILNKNLILENQKLEQKLNSDFLEELKQKSFKMERLRKLNAKLSKILKKGVIAEV